MKIKNVNDVDGIIVPEPFNRQVKMVFGPDRGEVKDLNLICAIIPAGSSTDKRDRDRTELVFILEGGGEFICNEKIYSLVPETAIYIEAGDIVQIRNTGKENLKLISVYREPFRAEDLYRKILDAAKK